MPMFALNYGDLAAFMLFLFGAAIVTLTLLGETLFCAFSSRAKNRAKTPYFFLGTVVAFSATFLAVSFFR
jgi:hypothetical protein